MLLCLIVAIQVHGVKKCQINGKSLKCMTVSIKKNVINTNTNTKNEDCQTKYHKCIDNINENLLSCKIEFSRCYQELYFTQKRKRRSTKQCDKKKCETAKKLCHDTASTLSEIHDCNTAELRCRRCALQ